MRTSWLLATCCSAAGVCVWASQGDGRVDDDATAPRPAPTTIPLPRHVLSLSAPRYDLAQETVPTPTVFCAASGAPSLLAPWAATERWRLDDGSLSRHHGQLRMMIEEHQPAPTAAAGRDGPRRRMPEMQLGEFVHGLEPGGADREEGAQPQPRRSDAKRTGTGAGAAHGPGYVFEDRFSRPLQRNQNQNRPHDRLLLDASAALPTIRLPAQGGVYKYAGAIPFRWFLLGGRGSGLGLHTDPHHSTAWNACVHGRKRWVFLPPSTPAETLLPAGEPEPDTAAAWFSGQYPRLALLHDIGMVEGVQLAGEIVVVPPGWHHVVINLEPTVALTMNFVREQDAGAALLEEASHPNNAEPRWRRALPLRLRLRVELARARPGVLACICSAVCVAALLGRNNNIV